MNVQTAINAGLFVQFVYNVWNSNGQSTDLNGMTVVNANKTPVVPGKTYKVIKTIYANDLATDISDLQLDRFVTIGIVAQSESDEADIVIAIRGTENIWEWLQDFKFLPKPFPNVPGGGLTEDGFTDMYLSFSFTPSPTKGFVEELVDAVPTNAMVTIGGHSLGASLSTLLAFDMAVNSHLPVASYTLASPRVGDLTFERLFNHVVPNAYRVVNRYDIVPKTPPPLLYFHVGDETEVLPSKTMKLELTCEHHLSSYLNMLGALIGQAQEYPIDSDCLKGATAPSSRTEV